MDTPCDIGHFWRRGGRTISNPPSSCDGWSNAKHTFSFVSGIIDAIRHNMMSTPVASASTVMRARHIPFPTRHGATAGAFFSVLSPRSYPACGTNQSSRRVASPPVTTLEGRPATTVPTHQSIYIYPQHFGIDGLLPIDSQGAAAAASPASPPSMDRARQIGTSLAVCREPIEESEPRQLISGSNSKLRDRDRVGPPLVGLRLASVKEADSVHMTNKIARLDTMALMESLHEARRIRISLGNEMKAVYSASEFVEIRLPNRRCEACRTMSDCWIVEGEGGPSGALCDFDLVLQYCRADNGIIEVLPTSGISGRG